MKKMKFSMVLIFFQFSLRRSTSLSSPGSVRCLPVGRRWSQQSNASRSSPATPARRHRSDEVFQPTCSPVRCRMLSKVSSSPTQLQNKLSLFSNWLLQYFRASMLHLMGLCELLQPQITDYFSLASLLRHFKYFQARSFFCFSITRLAC